MNDAMLVRMLERTRDLDAPREDVARRCGRVAYQLVERAAVHIFHDDEWRVLRLAHFVNGADARMLQDRCVRRLTHQAALGRRIREAVPNDCLDRNLASENGVSSAIHFAHSTRGNEFRDLVNPKQRTGRQA